MIRVLVLVLKISIVPLVHDNIQDCAHSSSNTSSHAIAYHSSRSRRFLFRSEARWEVDIFSANSRAAMPNLAAPQPD